MSLIPLYITAHTTTLTQGEKDRLTNYRLLENYSVTAQILTSITLDPLPFAQFMKTKPELYAIARESHLIDPFVAYEPQSIYQDSAEGFYRPKEGFEVTPYELNKFRTVQLLFPLALLPRYSHGTNFVYLFIQEAPMLTFYIGCSKNYFRPRQHLLTKQFNFQKVDSSRKH